MLETVLDWTLGIFLAGGLACGWASFFTVRKLKKDTSELKDDSKNLNEWAHKEHQFDKDHDAWALDTIQAICPHDDWEYSKIEKLQKRYVLYSPVGYIEDSFDPKRYKYTKICKVCGLSQEIDRDEYDEALREIEMVEIKKARAVLNERMKKVID